MIDEADPSPAIDLTAPQRAALRGVFGDFRNHIDLVGVYGSRVQGTARPGSDVDLVVYGELSPGDEAALRRWKTATSASSPMSSPIMPSSMRR